MDAKIGVVIFEAMFTLVIALLFASLLWTAIDSRHHHQPHTHEDHRGPQVVVTWAPSPPPPPPDVSFLQGNSMKVANEMIVRRSWLPTYHRQPGR